MGVVWVGGLGLVQFPGDAAPEFLGGGAGEGDDEKLVDVFLYYPLRNNRCRGICWLISSRSNRNPNDKNKIDCKDYQQNSED